MFHDIRDISDTEYPNRYKLRSFLDKKQFEHQIDIILKKYTVISSLDIFNLDLKNDSNHYATLTFDDGLSDHYWVYKYLKSINISGTFLVPSSPILNHTVMNTHKIQFILSSTNEKKIVEEILSNFNNKNELWKKYSYTNWKDNWWSEEMIFITNFLRNHKTESFDNYEYSDILFDKYVTKNENDFAKDFYLNTQQIEEMSEYMIIGGHGDISENLLLIDDVDSDIKKSYDFIKNYNNSFIFSYPNGGFSEDIKSIMRKYGCVLSYTTKQFTITDIDDIDYLEFPRYDAPQKISLPYL